MPLSKLEHRATFDRTSLANPVLQWAVRHQIGVVLVGARPGVAERAGRTMSALVPDLVVERTFSGYGEDPDAAKSYLLAHPGRLVVCGMGAPRQEAFLLALKEAGWRGIGITCGGFLDQLAERADYFPAWIDRLHLRFLYRLYREPRRPRMALSPVPGTRPAVSALPGRRPAVLLAGAEAVAGRVQRSLAPVAAEHPDDEAIQKGGRTAH